jgi:hypothetical protein
MKPFLLDPVIIENATKLIAAIEIAAWIWNS